MTKLERTERALDVAMRLLKCTADGTANYFTKEYANERLAEIDAILHPVEVEELPVVRWMCPHCDKVWPGDTVFQQCCGLPLIKLTGTIRRDKKVVERRVEIKGATFVLDNSAPHFCQKILAPWSDDVPTGKTGTLTFEWTE